jgi:acyl-homoserine-lactone acylase
MSRRDYLQNSNDSAWLTNLAAPITGYPDIVSRDSYTQAGRTRIGLAQLQARFSGSDGRPGNKFNLQTLQDTVLSNRVYYAEATLDDALAVMCTGSLTHTVDGQTVDLTNACNVLKNWDRRAEVTSVGVPLFEGLWSRIGNNPTIFAVPFNPADPVNTPRGIVKGNATVATALRDALARAVLQLNASGIPYDRPWGGVQVATKNIPIPIHGAASRTGDTGLGVYNSILSSVIGPKLPGARAVTYGSSYIQTVTWDDGGPVVDAFLTYSLSSNPASPYYADQTLRFANKNWIRLPFSEGAIHDDPAYSTVTISE